MGAVIVKNDEHGNNQVHDPQHEFALLMGDRTILADTRSELLDGLLPGYDARTGIRGGDEALWARHEFLSALAAQLGSVLLAEATQAGEVSPADLNEDELNHLLQPGTPGQAPFTGTWEHSVPLVALRIDYAPFSQVDLPEGNVRFLDASTETTTIDSLVEARLAEFMVATDLAGAA